MKYRESTVLYTYDRINTLHHIGTGRLSDRRTLLNVRFVHRLIRSGVNCANLLTTVNFHVPAWSCSLPLFYPAAIVKVLSRALLYNSLEAPDLSIFDCYSTFVQTIKNVSKT